MKRSILFCCLCSLLLGSCTKEPELDPTPAGEGDVWTTLDFTHTDYDQIRITTRSTLGPAAEARVSNIYVFLFNSAGERVYGHYFDDENKRSTRDEVVAANTNCWMVDNLVNEGGGTRGRIRMKIPQLTGGTFWLVSNLDTDMLNLSPEKFSFIRTIDELKALTVLLNQEITSRNGSFTMTGSAENITISDSGIFQNGASVVIPLNRLDAKIEVRVRAAVDNETQVNVSGSTTTQRIKGFTPESWQVVNLPKGCFLLEHAVAAEGGHDADTGFFDSHPVNFETQNEESFTYEKSDKTSVTVTAPVHGFSFYMYENRPEAKKTVTEYHQRDKRIKDDTGAYDTTDGLWENAPETSTYLVIKGEVAMDVDVSAEAKDQTLNAAVTYYIHLGDIGSIPNGLNDYRVNRNTHYTYTITIKGVENIQVEVETKVENESGATGHVYIAKESIYTFDSHYGQRVFAFDQASITSEDVTWYVKTPFGREGMPEVVNGAEIPNGLDYKWVSFRINDIEASGQYSHRNQKYDPDEVMDIIEFCDYIREQKERFIQNRTNDFRKEEDPELKRLYPDRPDIYTRYRIYATIFVDEFYYDRDPISGEVRTTLWKEFVNQPNRMMHILCDTKFSPDGDSSTTGSVVTIRQRSIQTIYNTEDESTQTAWGGESVDENEGLLWFYNRNETHWQEEVYPYVNKNYGNNSRANGLYNTARLWELTNGTGSYETALWDDYLDYDRENDHNLIFLKDNDDLATARYACLMRNRDNDGDGIIEASEIRWYLASLQQLTALYIGDQGLSSEAKLYDQFNGYGQNEVDEYGSHLWRRHIISSTRWGSGSTSNYPAMLWAEEGLSTSAYKQYANSKPGRYTVRCVRNLGMDPASEQEAIQALNDADRTPEVSIRFQTVEENHSATSVYRFDLSRINKKSIRYYTSRELEPGDEYAESARVYSKFETGPLVSYSGSYGNLKSMIERGESPCPDGYRVPNIREASLMANYITSDVNSDWWPDYAYVNTYYSFGTLGKNYDETSTTWFYKDNHITVNGSATRIRCVRDIQ